MARVCVLAHQLAAAANRAGDGRDARAWDVVSGLVAARDTVVLVHTDPKISPSDDAYAIRAAGAGAKFVAISRTPAPLDLPVFPAAEIHTAAFRVAAMLEAEPPDVCLVLDEAAAAALATGRRRTGVALAQTRFVFWLDAPPRELARLNEPDIPAPGRDEIVHDFLERQALVQADEILVTSAAVMLPPEFLTPTGAVSPGVAPRVVSPDDLATVRASLRPGDAPPAVAKPARISVCLPYYNQPAFFPEALATLAAQSEAPYEVIVLDDGTPSADGVQAFAEAEKKYEGRGWRFLRQANTGAAEARNRLAQAASGDVLLFCDHDNRFHPDMIASFARAFTLTGADCITCGFRAFASDDAANPEDRGYLFSPLGQCIELGLVENVLGDNNFLVRRSTFFALGGFTTDRSANEDWQFLLQLLRGGGKVAAIPATLFEYRRLAASRVRSVGEFTSAVHTLAPILAESDPAWRRLWPHLVAAIRNPQVPYLQHQLEAQRQRHLAAVAAVEQALAGAQHELSHTQAELRRTTRRSKWERFVQKAAAESAAEAKAAAAAAAAEAAVRYAELEGTLAATQRDREQQIAERDARIRRMQSTWSWQATAPARALRRALIDPLRRKQSRARPSEATPSLPFRHAIDQPMHWDSAAAAGRIRGWCVFGDADLAQAVRLTIDGQEIPGEGKLLRRDVANALGLPETAATCGFDFGYRLAPDRDHAVRLEARGPDGAWYRLYEGVLHTTQRPRDAKDYAAWVESFSTVTPEKAAALRERLARLPDAQRPLISVLMPVHNAPERWLQRAIESVREQIYDHWELCIADDTSTAPHVLEVLDQLQRLDPRIRVRFRPVNGHISAASNSALELVRGDYVALLDHDDELSPDALAEVALLLAEHPETDLVYSDEDKIDEQGRRHTPYFKPDYLPDLLLGQNCLSHLSVYRTALVRRVGGFRVGYEGSQDWDLALRVVEQTSPNRIRHLPKVLYHWRTISGSTAVAVSAKNYSVDAARRALLDHFARRGITADVRPVTGHHWQIIYSLPDPAPLVSIIIPTRDRARLLRTCIGSLLARTDYPRFEVLIVNNGSSEPDTHALFAELREEEDVRILDFDGPFNFSAINNFAAREARGSVLCFLNNDIEVITGRWLEELVSNALRPEIGAVGAMLYYPNAKIQHAGVVLGLGGVANHAFLNYPHGTDGYMNRARLAQNYSAVTAACLVVRREVFEKIGGFNERDLAVAFNDIDLCLRIRAAGYQNLWTPFAELYHHESASRGDDNAAEHQPRFVREIEYMRRTWGEVLDHDPAYNPNLSLDLLGWQLAWPPRA